MNPDVLMNLHQQNGFLSVGGFEVSSIPGVSGQVVVSNFPSASAYVILPHYSIMLDSESWIPLATVGIEASSKHSAAMPNDLLPS